MRLKLKINMSNIFIVKYQPSQRFDLQISEAHLRVNDDSFTV